MKINIRMRIIKTLKIKIKKKMNLKIIKYKVNKGLE